MPDAHITKKALASALKELMQTKPFARVSVGEVCELCGMNRKSFYYHFQDKYELVTWIYNTEFLELMYQKEYEDTWGFLLDFCDYFARNRAFYLNVFEVTGQNSFRDYHVSVFYPLIAHSLTSSLKDTKHQRFFSEFFAEAMLIALEKWLREDTMPPEEFVRLLQGGVEGMARRVTGQAQDQSHAGRLAPEASPGE